MLYFAYGCTMERVQMKRICPGAKFVAAGRLRDHELAFTRMSPFFGGGVGDLRPAPGKVVEGVLWEIEAKDVKALDDCEDTPRSYSRREVVVETSEGKSVTAFTYCAVPTGEYTPSRRYMKLVISGAEEHDLSLRYVEYLESIKTRG